MTASRFLRGVGEHATIAPDPWISGAYVLSIGGAEQSHVNLAEPQEVFYEYLLRMAHVIDLCAPARQPIRILHLGAGALTLARYVEVTRPGSEQVGVERERELWDFVESNLPLPAGSNVTMMIADARDALGQVTPPFDVIILDIFSGPEAPEHIAHPDFYAKAAALLNSTGVLLVNVGDEPGLTLVRSQLRAIRGTMAHVAALGPVDIFTGKYPGNIVLVGTQFSWPASWTDELLARGPHPAQCLTGPDADVLA